MRTSDLWSQLIGRIPSKVPARRSSTSRRDTAALRVLLLNDTHGATQTISFHRPLSDLIATGRCYVEAFDERQVAADGGKALIKTWHDIQPTVLVLSRYAGGGERAAVELARRSGVHIVYHIDDNLFAVPRELGADKFARYNVPNRLARLEAAMRAADVIYASTPELARQLGARLPGTKIVSGDIYCAQAAVHHGPSAGSGTGRTIGYMGTSGHAQDLEMVVPAVAALLAREPQLRFETFGTIRMPSALARFEGRITRHNGMADYASFMRHLAGVGWHIGLAPVLDSPFNRCKADTKWVEYTSAGIAVVASDLPVYHRACAGGAGVLAPAHGWEAAISELLSNEAARIAAIERAQARLAADYNPDRLTNQLLAILET